MKRKITPKEIDEAIDTSYNYRFQQMLNMTKEVQDMFRHNERVMRLAAQEIEQLEERIARLSDVPDM